ncbi:kinesin-like protein KIF26B isoform X2 [Magallana gigas]|uniref:kinesin-like protein KIF26B isoform X2 n=1 Tax=Magallana gigas TaxID=29159 RepID=UPI0033400233
MSCENEGRFCTENVSVKAAVCMFGGEAKIRKLPTPDRTFKKDAAENATSSPFSDNAENSDEKLNIQETDVKGQASNMDYTISGTISPLPGIHESSGKRGTESKISFVFGRPPSPTSRCMSPPQENHVHAVARKGPGPPSRYRGRNGKPPVYVPPNKSAKVPYLAIVGMIGNPGLQCCDQCVACLVDLKQQALHLMNSEGFLKKTTSKSFAVERIGEHLQIPDACRQFQQGLCNVCDTSIVQLKREVTAMVQSIHQAQTESPVQSGHVITQQPSNRSLKPKSQGSPVTSGGGGPYNGPLEQPHLSNHLSRINQMLAQQRASASGTKSFPENLSQVMEHSMMYPGSPHSVTPSQVRQQNMHSNSIHSAEMGHYNPPMQAGHSPYHAQQYPRGVHTSPHNYPNQPYSAQHVTPGSPYRGQPTGTVYHMNQYPDPVQSPQYSHLQYSVTGTQYGSPVMNYSVPSSPMSPVPHHARAMSPPQVMSPPHAMSPPPFSRVSSPGSVSSQQSAAASFFARAAQKLGKKKKRHQQQEPDLPLYPTKYNEVIKNTPPPAPPCLLRAAGRLQQPGIGKVKVMLKICTEGSHSEQAQSCLSIDPRKKQVTVFDPSTVGVTLSSHRRATPVAPKMFAFDAVFSPDDSQTEICSSSLTEIIQGVVNGADGCLFSYGYSRQGKSYTMMGNDVSAQSLGIMPCAIAWLFRLIDEQKEKTGARFSVRVSAVEVSGKNEQLKDLLADVAKYTEAGVGTAPGVYLREDPICGTQLENQSELRAPTADRAAYYLDAALASRAQDDEELRSSHIVFTLHVYQYRIEKANQAGLPGVAGGRSRLHLIDLGSSSKSKDPDNVSLSLSALGNVIMALLNGQRHVPHRDSKVAQLLRDSLGGVSCRTCMLVHVSSAVSHHNETLQVIQLAARIHRMRRRKTKFSSTSSDDSSTDDGRLRRPFKGCRMGTLREDILYHSSHSDPDYYTSSSEQSCDTVIYVGAHGQSLSDREITDNEGPPRSVPRTNPRLPRRPSGSRSSGDEGSNSDSGRSRASSDFRYGRAALIQKENFNVNRIISPRFHPQPAIAVSSPSVVRDVSVVQTHAKSPPVSPIVGPVQHPLKSQTRSRSQDSPQRLIVKGPPSDQLKGEQWIDGPGIYSKSKQVEEQWIDGPQAFVKQELVNTLDPANKHLFNPKMNAEEQWVDGPREMIAESKLQNREAKVSHSKATVHSSCKGDKHSKHKRPLLDIKDRPDSTLSEDSSSSLTVQGPDSRPVSLHEPEDKPDAPQQSVKPFVRDWVQKHSAIADNSSAPKREDRSEPAETPCKMKKPKPESHRKLSASTPKQSPLNSPCAPRKTKCDSQSIGKLQKSHLPTPQNPTKRVKDWIQSVSLEQTQSNCENFVSVNDFCSDLPVRTSELNTSQDVSSCSSIQLETTAEMDSQCETTMNTAPCSSDGRPDEMAECNIGDISFDSSVDAGENTNSLHRESIYEMQMDAQLEKSDVKNVDIPDNDTFSSVSKDDDSDCENEPLLAKEFSIPHSLTAESLKTLVAEPIAEDEQKLVQGQSYQSSEINPNIKESLFIYDKAKPISSLHRKPDGASNPNLVNELDYQDRIDVNFIRGEYIINQVQHISSQNVDIYQKATSVLKYEEPDCRKSKSKPPLPKPSCKSHSASPSRCKDISLSPKSTGSYSSRTSSPGSHVSRTKEKSRQISTSSMSSQSSLPIASSPSSKSSKSPSPSKLPIFSSKSSRKKDKEYKVGNGRVVELNTSNRGTDSDSGNDSGIVAHEKKLLSPYSTVTKPRTPSHSSSGHGSDNSSTVSADLRSQLGIKDKLLTGGTSSGYESMLRDSEEASVTSSGQEESTSESPNDKKKGSKKKKSSTKRSRSAPARSSESPDGKGSVILSPSSKAWVDTRQIQRIKEEPFEIKLYDMDDVERLARRRNEEEENESKKEKGTKHGKPMELIDHKDQIVMENRHWRFDCRFFMCFCRNKPKQTDV